MFSFHLPENPSAEQVRKVIAVIGHAAGAEVMREVAGSFAQPAIETERRVEMVPARESLGTLVVPPPPVPDLPPPPPPPSAPPAPAPVELDASNMPWDARIHSSTKGQNKDGSWKAKRGLDDTTKMTVTAELRALYPAPAATQAQPAPAAPPPPPPSAAPPVPGASDVSSFAGVMTKLSGLIQARKVTKEQATAAAVAVGVQNTIALAGRPDLWANFCAHLDVYAAGLG